MYNFIELNNLPVYDLYTEFLKLLNQKKIWWHSTNEDQICINATINDPGNCLTGRGSLFYDWDNSYMEGNKWVIPEREKKLKETDFTVLCEGFKESMFEDVYNYLIKRYTLGRIRIMKSKPKTCLTWHVDDTPRIHYPMKTQNGCFMVIGNESKHLENNKWYLTNTLLPHTAFNGSIEDRIHLVAVVLENK